MSRRSFGSCNLSSASHTTWRGEWIFDIYSKIRVMFDIYAPQNWQNPLKKLFCYIKPHFDSKFHLTMLAIFQRCSISALKGPFLGQKSGTSHWCTKGRSKLPSFKMDQHLSGKTSWRCLCRPCVAVFWDIFFTKWTRIYRCFRCLINEGVLKSNQVFMWCIGFGGATI